MQHDFEISMLTWMYYITDSYYEYENRLSIVLQSKLEQ